MPKCLELNFRGFSPLKKEIFSGGGPPDPRHKNHLNTLPSYAPAIYLFMVQKSQNWPKTHIKGSCLNVVVYSNYKLAILPTT